MERSQVKPTWKPPLQGVNASDVTERIIDTAGGFVIERQQVVDDVIEAVHDYGSALPKSVKNQAMRYVGSIPVLIANQWSAECGAAIGTREFAEYVEKKLLSSDFSKLVVDYR